MEEYVKGDNCAWETVLDIDELGKRENESWVYQGKTMLDEGPGTEQDLCIVKLSRGGADATVLREFSLKGKTFVTDNPFNAPEVSPIRQADGLLKWLFVPCHPLRPLLYGTQSILFFCHRFCFTLPVGR